MRTSVIIGGLLVLLAVAGIYAASRARTAQPIVGTQPAAVPFQPEAQTLYNATNPGGALKRPNANSPQTQPIPFNASACSKSGDVGAHFDCLEKYYQTLVDNYGVDVAFSDLKERYAGDPFTVNYCHPLTHAIGREAVTLYPTVSDAYQHGDSFCWSGYYHGVLEGIVAKIGKENLTAQINTICADIPGKATYSFDYYNCVHGLGHGVMELNGDDVFLSLKQCDALSGNWEQESCYSGVFMENIINFEHDGDSPDIHKNELLYPCTAVDAKYKYECYLGQTSFVLLENGGNFKATFGLCANVESPYRDVCNQSLGRDAANYANHDGAKTKVMCDLSSSTNDTNNCVIGAEKEFISYYHSLDQANAYCALYSSPEKESCLNTATSYFKSF